MISRMRSFLVVLCLLGAVRAAEAGGKMELPPVKVRSTVEGAYDVLKAGDRVGRESFTETVFSNNTVVYESVFEVFEGEATLVSGNNRLEVEEDTGFPRRYLTQRRTRSPDVETMREVTVELYSNVAVVLERQDERERQSEIVLPTGCLFVESNTARHLVVVLDRYNRQTGGRQSFRAFDPLGVAETDVTLEAVGDTTFAGLPGAAPGAAGPGGRTLAHFRYRAGRSGSVADLFVDENGRIARIETGTNELVYNLVSIEEKSGGTDPAERARRR
jgi:hypothetical protein